MSSGFIVRFVDLRFLSLSWSSDVEFYTAASKLWHSVANALRRMKVVDVGSIRKRTTENELNVKMSNAKGKMAAKRKRLSQRADS